MRLLDRYSQGMHDRLERPRRALTALAAVLVLSAVTAASALSAAPPALDSVILRAAQIGEGYERAPFPNGRNVKGAVTLDFCGSGYPSEKLRLRRFQALYGMQGSSLVLSNEVVQYKPGGAARALAEVAKRTRTCPKTAVKSGSAAGVTEKYLKITLIHDSKLLPGSVAVEAVVTYTFKGKTRRDTILAIYQRHGDYLSGVYAYGGTAASRKATSLRAAHASAENLKLTDHLTA
jgi:hypothetical protein